MSLIRLHNVSKKYDETLIFHEVFFRLSQGDRVGLIGKNGAGKTTVLRLILGQEEPTEGTIDLDDGIRLGYFSQFSELNGEQSIQEVLLACFAGIQAIEEEMLEIEIALEEAPPEGDTSSLLARYDHLMEKMNRREGWTYHNRIDTVLTRLGFSERHRTCPIETLSGGWRNRAALAKILLEDPGILLLDEPTNFLDFDGLTWLEAWLNDLPGAVLVVSHDRHFLDRVINRVVEIENYRFQEYEGNFSQYIRKKQIRFKSLERQFQHEEELLAFEAEAIEDRREAARNPSKALQRRLANIKKRAEPRLVDKIVTDVYDGLKISTELCQVENVSKAYNGLTLFENLSLGLHKEDRLVIVGPNGVGKTTLLKLLREEEAPDTGRVVWLHGNEYADYRQTFEGLDLNDTVSHAVNIASLAYLAPRKRVNRFLSLFQFSEMDLRQKIGTLSGGQKARVALAQCLLSGHPVVLLDEPTNHLDLTSTQVMERALKHFPGAIVVVSHDRFFIDKVATRLLIFNEPGQTEMFEGNWTLWQASQEE